jgi:pyrroloquinoline quinone biosynthesis protein B
MRGQLDGAGVIAGCVVAFALGCAPSSTARRDAIAPEAGAGLRGPSELRVLGTAQDGGLPHAACTCDRCEAARRDPNRARRVAALALVTSDGVRLIDATPDLPAQLHALADVRRPVRGSVDRTPIDGILLTHAHVGHYLGLAWLGFEAIAAEGVPVHASAKMGAFLRGSGPWSQLVAQRDIVLHELAPGVAVKFADVDVVPIVVPHRDEFSDTLGFRFVGPRATVLYVPDTEPWSRWPNATIEDELRDVDVALLDGSFYSPGELPGRPVESIGHPLMIDTMDRLAPLVREGGLRVFFTHMNHSNPALEPDSPERAEIERRGFAVLADGDRFAL